MKRNDWILLISVALYSFLFYEQAAGINFLIFNLALIACLVLLNKSLLRKRTWQVAAAGSIISALSVCLYGNGFAVVMNAISLSLLSVLSTEEKSSVIISLLFAAYSYASAPVYMVLNALEKKMDATKEGKDGGKKIILIGIPVLITLVFFFIYRASNALFNDLASKINLDFISWTWVAFTIGGFILLYGFFRPEKIVPLAEWDKNSPDNISSSEENKLVLFEKEISIIDENFSGKLLFIMLNTMLLLVNALDFNFLFINRTLPPGVNYSQFVHQGIDMLIVSIVVAIAIILFYFRGRLNFFEKSKTIKTLAYLWIIQNAVMLFSSACRNLIYVHECGLTYKRIGVYVYLFLTVIGLLTTLYKISSAKSNSFLFRINGWVVYIVLILFTTSRWDTIITSYNLSHSLKYNDIGYLVRLSDSNIPDLVPVYADAARRTMVVDTIAHVSFEKAYGRKLYAFLNNNSSKDWRSWCYDNQRVFNDVNERSFSERIDYLNLSDIEMQDFSLRPLKQFSNIKGMDLHNSGLRSTRDLNAFPELKHLDLSSNRLMEISGLSSLKNLEYLNLSRIGLVDYSPLYKLPRLKELYVNIIYPYQYDELCQHLPGTHIYSSYY
ncbi:MAG TPA: DUF4153 domain-containing protein [Bacteroidia bacterium]|jgi:hypothetical protein|nr:DUF4153 domain-containing protein [Bacteroidia bacterium]